jgi:ABC-2 type transport system permease protein
MTLPRGLVVVVRLDFAEVLRSRWLVFCVGVFALIAAIFTFVGLRESTVLGFTGMSRALLSFMNVLVLVLPLLALTATTQAIARARDDGALELLLTQPISRSEYFGALAVVRYLALLLPLAALVVVMSALGVIVFGEEVAWSFLFRTLALSAALLWAFVGLGLLVAAYVHDLAKAIMYALLLWALGVALLDFALVGMMLAWRLDARVVFLLAALNPVEASRLALLSSATPDLGVLGPVGFFLATRIGPSALFALGIAWPGLVGTAAFAVAMQRFRRADLV